MQFWRQCNLSNSPNFFPGRTRFGFEPIQYCRSPLNFQWCEIHPKQSHYCSLVYRFRVSHLNKVKRNYKSCSIISFRTPEKRRRKVAHTSTAVIQSKQLITHLKSHFQMAVAVNGYVAFLITLVFAPVASNGKRDAAKAQNSKA